MVSQNLISFECYFKHLWMVIIRIPTANGGKVQEMKDRIAIVSLGREQNHFKTTLNCFRKEFIQHNGLKFYLLHFHLQLFETHEIKGFSKRAQHAPPSWMQAGLCQHLSTSDVSPSQMRRPPYWMFSGSGNLLLLKHVWGNVKKKSLHTISHLAMLKKIK